MKTVICFILALGTAILYWPVRHFEFVNFDDYDYVVDNPHVSSGVTLANLRWAFASGYASNWHPITWFSHMIDVQLFGLNPGPHHVINLLFHIGNALLLFLVLDRMTRAMWPSALVAALFAWHPLHVESVAWIAERKDVLSTFFGLLTLWFYAQYAESRNRKHLAFALICFAAGLMAKPMLVTLPLVLLLLDYWPLKRPLQILEKAPFFLLSLLSSLVTFWAQRSGGAVAGLQNVPFQYRLANALLAYTAYLRKMFVPLDLGVIYPISNAFSWWQIPAAAAILLAVSATAVYWNGRRPWLLIGWLWFLGILVPTIGLIQVGSQALADRYTYLPIVGIFIMLVWTCAETRPKLLAGTAVVILPVLCVLTAVQVRTWRDSESLFRHAAAVTKDNYIAHSNLGRVLVNQRRYREAQAEFEEVLRIFPDQPEGRFNLSRTHFNAGNAFMRNGQPDQAIAHFEAAARIDPSFAEAQNNWANALAMQGRFAEAAGHYAAALRINPSFAEARLNADRLRERLDKPSSE